MTYYIAHVHTERDQSIDEWLADNDVSTLFEEAEEAEPFTGTAYDNALRIVCDFTEGLTTTNEEYVRGQLEMLADMFPVSNMETDVRMGQIARDIRALAERDLQAQLQETAKRLSAEDRTVSFHLVYEPEDADDDYRWQCRVTMSWVQDEDHEARQENGHGKTPDEAFALARKIAAAFMFEKSVAACAWPPNGIDSMPEAPPAP